MTWEMVYDSEIDRIAGCKLPAKVVCVNDGNRNTEVVTDIDQLKNYVKYCIEDDHILTVTPCTSEEA